MKGCSVRVSHVRHIAPTNLDRACAVARRTNLNMGIGVPGTNIREGRQRQQGCDATTEAFATERGSTPQTSAAICMTTSLLSYDFHSVSRGCEAPRHNKGEREGNVSRMFRHRLGSAGRGGSNPPSPTKERRQDSVAKASTATREIAAPTPKPVRVAYHKCYKNKVLCPPSTGWWGKTGREGADEGGLQESWIKGKI